MGVAGSLDGLASLYAVLRGTQCLDGELGWPVNIGKSVKFLISLLVRLHMTVLLVGDPRNPCS